ncbi:MAG: polyprenol monophosphomannose synthase [Chloroflexi bacterium]|nr:polyprenol monophosphomannose synthase [Chloroflexota bacterium]
MRIQVIIPTYNEAENLRQLVSVLFSLPLDLSVLVVDDNSPDGTGQVADSFSASYPGRMAVIHRPRKLGLRSAYMVGFQASFKNGIDAIAQMDADFSHDPQALVAMAQRLAECDLALGSRYTDGGRVDEAWPAWRKALSAFGNFYARSILGLDLHDVTTGFRLWRREALQGMPLERVRSNGYILLVEMAYLADCLEYRLAETPIYFADRKWGKSKMSLRIQVEAAFRVWQVRWAYRDLRRLGKAGRLALPPAGS